MHTFLKGFLSIFLGAALLCITACSSSASDNNTVRVGTIAGPETELMEVAAQVAKQKYGLNVKIVTFSDYNLPNEALNDGSIDANAFQHIPFLEKQIAAQNYKIVSIGKTFLYPMGLYSKKIKNLVQLKNGSKVAIPNDPSNEARALLLLQKAGLITLKPGAMIDATINQVESNPKNLKLVELDAAQIPRSMDDVTLGAINTNFAIPAGYTLQKALFVEGTDSPYTNIIVARTSDATNPKLKELVEAFQSPEVAAKAKALFGDAAIPGWN